MKLVSWNVNSLPVRLPRVLELLDEHAPDIVLLQETKTAPDGFPADELRAAGYESVHHSAGRWAGVALLAREPLGDVCAGLAGEPAVDEARWIEATRRVLASGNDTKVLMLTTFDLNEYVYEALRAGASGFLLKDVPPEQLAAGIRVVAQGDALLAPSITRRLIEEFASASPAAATPPKGLDELTARELEVFKLIARGLSNAEIAAELIVSETTVKTHVARLLMKLSLRDRVQAVVLAYESGLVTPGAT